ncbi:MAG: hypothetical protein AAGD92_13450 [Pseudomonadota bacterium]
MMNSVSGSPHAESDDWDALFADIKQLAAAKAARMLVEADNAEAAFDGDARVLRTLIGAAEIIARIRKQNGKEPLANGQTAPTRERTEEEIDAVYRSAVRAVMRNENRDCGGNSAAEHSEGDGSGDAGRGCGQGVADPCA